MPITAAVDPDPATRARSLLACASTAEVWWLDDGSARGGSTTVPALHLVVDERTSAPGARPVLIEVADAAPVPVRDRIRARLRISGHAEPGDDGAIRVRPVSVVLLTATETLPLRLADFLAAEPDPLCGVEGTLLSHLHTAHPEVIEHLTRLLSPRLLHGVVAARPLALDQRGLVLRLEYAARHDDVRLSFTSPAPTPVEVRHRLAAMLADAGTPRRRRLSRAPEATRRRG